MAVLLVAEANPRHIALVTGAGALLGRRWSSPPARCRATSATGCTTFVDTNPANDSQTTKALILQSQQSQTRHRHRRLTGQGFCKGR